jgi:hypothetical protein
LSQFGAKAQGSAFAVAPVRACVCAGLPVPRGREEVPGAGGDSRQQRSGCVGVCGCGVFRDMLVVLALDAITRPGLANVDAPAVAFPEVPKECLSPV